jgi:hypothetical protein
VTIPDALRKLRLFNEKAATLSGYSFMPKAQHPDAGFTIEFHADEGIVRTEKIGADDEATARRVLVLRFFIMPGEGIQPEQVDALYQQLPLPDEDRYWVSENMKALNAFLDRVELTCDNLPITNRLILDTYMWGHYAHAKNQDHVARYNGWQSPLTKTMLDSLFEHAVKVFVQYVQWFARINEDAIRTLVAL